ncbi:hypothetical protein ACLB2K_072778 [Fragaria x ananassa]
MFSDVQFQFQEEEKRALKAEALKKASKAAKKKKGANNSKKGSPEPKKLLAANLANRDKLTMHHHAGCTPFIHNADKLRREGESLYLINGFEVVYDPPHNEIAAEKAMESECDWESDLRKLLLYKWRYVVSVALIKSVLRDSPSCQRCKAIYLLQRKEGPSGHRLLLVTTSRGRLALRGDGSRACGASGRARDKIKTLQKK